MPSDQKPQTPRKDEKAQSQLDSAIQATRQQVKADETELKSAIQAARQQVEVDDVELKTIEIRLTGIKEAAQRSRFVFLVMTIAAAAILITLWSSYVSWNLGHASEKRMSDRETVRNSEGSVSNVDNRTVSTSKESVSDVESRAIRNQDELISEWVKGRTISVGLLGIRVGVEDLAVIGSIGLIVIMIWYFFSQRRENRAIVSLLRDCTQGLKDWRLDKDVCSMVHQAIVHSLVFIDIKQGDAPLSGLENNEEKSKPPLIRLLLGALIRLLLRALVYLPPITILLIIASDIYTLRYPSLFRVSTDTLWDVVLQKGWRVEAKVFGFELFAVVAAIYTAILCHQSREFSKATAETLGHFEAIIKDPDEFLKDPDAFLNDKRRVKS